MVTGTGESNTPTVMSEQPMTVAEMTLRVTGVAVGSFPG